MSLLNQAKSLLVFLWDFFNGKKVVIGASIWVVASALASAQAHFNVQVVDPSLLNTVEKWADGLTAVGLLHKAQKQL